jgi:GTP cyclohydrolase I
VVEILAARPQLQENLTAQIADAIETGLDARGVIVVVEAKHQCVASRGARQPEVNTITMASRGAFSEPSYRAEVMGLINK